MGEITKETPAVAELEKKRALPESNGVLRNPACQRCQKTKKTCVEQKGSSLACYPCAKLKMKCDPATDSLAPSLPAPGVGPSTSQKPSKKAKVVKTPENVESSGSEILQKPAPRKPAPRPATVRNPPALVPRKRKGVDESDVEAKKPAPHKKPARIPQEKPAPVPAVDSGEEESDSEEEVSYESKMISGGYRIPASKNQPAPAKGRTIADFQTYYGIFSFFSSFTIFLKAELDIRLDKVEGRLRTTDASLEDVTGDIGDIQKRLDEMERGIQSANVSTETNGELLDQMAHREQEYERAAEGVKALRVIAERQQKMIERQQKQIDEQMAKIHKLETMHIRAMKTINLLAHPLLHSKYFFYYLMPAANLNQSCRSISLQSGWTLRTPHGNRPLIPHEFPSPQATCDHGG